MAINISARYKLFFKWTILVWLNAAVSFAIAMDRHQQPSDIVGMICGVFTFVGIYTALDYYLIKKQAIKLRKSLFIAVLLKALTQFYPMIEMLTGSISTLIIKDIVWDDIPFLSTYLTTLTDGILLSIIVYLFLLIISFITFIIRRFKQKNIQ
ncbi:MAG: hypothetical protein Q7U23_04160 [Methylococcales bacterium]|nr:hypothetical protein [Methylococcales bacterium]